MNSVIQFYGVSSEYGEFSNFAPYPIALGGKHWSSEVQLMVGSKD